MDRFKHDVSVSQHSGFTLTSNGLTTNLMVPLVVLADLGTEKKRIPSEGASVVNYEIKTNPEREDCIVKLGDYDVGRIRHNHGKQDITMTGKWTYNGKIESVEVKVPKLPERSADLGVEAQLKYFQTLTEAKKTKNFSGQTLPQPELYILWIPRKEDFEVKVEKIEIVHPDPALIMRIDGKHDHVLSLWHTETEEPLEFLVRRHTQ